MNQSTNSEPVFPVEPGGWDGDPAPYSRGCPTGESPPEGRPSQPDPIPRGETSADTVIPPADSQDPDHCRESLAANLPAAGTGPGRGEEKESVAQTLLRIASRARLLRGIDGRFYASV